MIIIVKCLEYLKCYFKSFAPFVTETDGRGKRVHIQQLDKRLCHLF